MNYIYDIYLNFNEVLYDFFDWNKSDKITHIKKIPVIKVKEETLRKIITNKIQISDKTLIQIYNKTEMWNINIKIPYCTLFTDGNNISSIEFDNKGNSIRKSYLFIDEELEVLEVIKKLSYTNIEYTVIQKEKSLLNTRKQIQEQKFIRKELINMENNKLSYIYFECFGKQEKNRNIILKNINKISNNSKVYKNLYEILKLTSTSKNK